MCVTCVPKDHREQTCINSALYFCLGATFEMRTVLYRICLLIDKVKTYDRVFISNNFCGEGSKTAERQKEKEKVCVRGSALVEMGDSIGNKINC